MIEEISTRAGSARARGGIRRRPRWWLIAKTEDGGVEFLTTARDEDGEETLPVFSYEQEAKMFLHLGGYGGGWSARESSSGEIVSVLCGPCSGAEGVALDPPLPGMVANWTVCFVWLGRERFLGWLLGYPQ